MIELKLHDILSGSENRLGIKQMTGKAGLMKESNHIHVQRYSEGEVFWEKIIPDTLLVITSPYLSKLSLILSEARENIYQNIISDRILCVAISETDSSCDFIHAFSRRYNIPVFTSIYDEFLLESRLIGLIREKINNFLFIHGALVNVFGRGVLITGESGSGKTDCACKLVKKGHVWIADDAVEVEKRGNALYGRSCALVKHLINIKDKGIMNVKDFLGDAALYEETIINLMIELKDKSNTLVQQGVYAEENFQDIMGIKLPYIPMPLLLSGSEMHSCVEHAVQRINIKRGIT